MNPNNPHTPEAVPKTASNFLEAADRTLDSRGQQYDPNGKQERSMTAIVAAFNAIYPVYAQHGMPLTVHQGWQFMTLVKMVRGATKPHADSALDQVAYAALAAEEVASGLQAAQSSKLGSTLQEALCEDEGCPHHGKPHVCITSAETAEQHKARVAAQHEAEVDRLKAIIAAQDARLHNLQLAHKAQVTELVAELADKNNLLKDAEARACNLRNLLECAEQQLAEERASHKATNAAVSRLLAKNNALCNEVRKLEVAVASVRNSLKVSEDAASQLQAKALYHQEQHNATLLELRKEKEAHKHTARVRYS